MASDSDMTKKHAQSSLEWLKKHKLLVVVALVLLVITITVTTITLPMVSRSKESFCKVLNENKEKLVGSKISLQERLDIYKKLESVAPSDIAPDMQRIVKAYQSGLDKPETAMAAEFGIMGEIQRLNTYKNEDCKEK